MRVVIMEEKNVPFTPETTEIVGVVLARGPLA